MTGGSAAGRPHLVGETGPEVIVPSAGRLVAALTVNDLKRRLAAMYKAWVESFSNGHLDDADAAYAEIDTLLERLFDQLRQP